MNQSKKYLNRNWLRPCSQPSDSVRLLWARSADSKSYFSFSYLYQYKNYYLMAVRFVFPTPLSLHSPSHFSLRSNEMRCDQVAFCLFDSTTLRLRFAHDIFFLLDYSSWMKKKKTNRVEPRNIDGATKHWNSCCISTTMYLAAVADDIMKWRSEQRQQFTPLDGSQRNKITCMP